MVVRIPAQGAVIFDLDGTLVDSSSVVERHWGIWAHQHGIELRLVMEVAHGRPALQTMRMFIPDTPEDEAWAFDASEAADLEGVRPVPGAGDAIKQCEEEGTRWAIVTSGTLPMATHRLNACRFPVPTVFVTVEQTERGKPAPDPYLRAAMLLGVVPAACSVFEDSPPGVHSAKAAGMRVIALTTTHAPDQLSAADEIVRDFSEITITNQETDHGS
jgi:sugar-phosphatase